MSIDIRLLRYAQALAEHRSFSRAAAALHIAQPSLSRGIQELEARVRLPLFVRSRSGHEPTDFGRVFLQRAAEVLALMSDLEREAALARGLGTAELSVAMGPYAAEIIGPGCATRFMAGSRGVRLRLRASEPAGVAQLLRARTVDVGIAESSVLEDTAELEIVTRLAPVAGHVVVRAGHPLARQANVALADVVPYPFAEVMMLVPRVLTPLLAAFRAASARGATVATPFPAIECPTADFAARIVARSDAFTFTTLGTVRAELERGEIVPVHHEPWLCAEWSVARLRTRTMSHATRTFVEAAQQAHADMLAEEEVLRARWCSPRPPRPIPARGADRSVRTQGTPSSARTRRSGR